MVVADPVRAKALAVLRDGRLTVLSAKSDPDTLTVTAALAQVRGHQGTYAVDLRGGQWSCTCRKSLAGIRCGHVFAAQLVLGAA